MDFLQHCHICQKCSDGSFDQLVFKLNMYLHMHDTILCPCLQISGSSSFLNPCQCLSCIYLVKLLTYGQSQIMEWVGPYYLAKLLLSNMLGLLFLMFSSIYFLQPIKFYDLGHINLIISFSSPPVLQFCSHVSDFIPAHNHKNSCTLSIKNCAHSDANYVPSE